MKKNLIVITIDGGRVDRIKQFPGFSRLIKEGMFFSNMITYYPGTIASMHSIFTGAHGRNNGVDNYWAAPKFKSSKYKTLPEYFKDNGYFTKGDIINEMIIPKIGFDELTIHDEYKDDLNALHQSMIKEIRNKAGEKPFFLYLHYSSVHTSTTLNFIKKFNGEFDENFYNQEERKAEYDSYLQKADEYLSMVMKTMEEGGLEKDTIFLVLSDHGTGNGEKFGERRYGFYCYNYTLKAFFIIKNAGLPCKEYISLVRTTDVLPTLLDILGFSFDHSYLAFDGKSVLPLISGEEQEERVAFSETAGSDGYGPKEPRTKSTIVSLTTNQWKYIFNLVTGNKEMYSLVEDPEEKTNLIGKGLEIESGLHARLMEFLKKKENPALNLGGLALDGLKIKEYLNVNKKTFDALAHEYQEKWGSSLEHQREYLAPFVQMLKKHNGKVKPNVLDIGCGVGLDLHVLSREGFETHGIDFSEEMISYAQKNCPSTKFVCKNIFEHEDERKYNGIILDTFIHLFPKDDAEAVLRKVSGLLDVSGILFVSTTEHDSPSEGYVAKEDYGLKLERYRKRWMFDELQEFLEYCGYEVILSYSDQQPHLNKKWMNFILKKK